MDTARYDPVTGEIPLARKLHQSPELRVSLPVRLGLNPDRRKVSLGTSARWARKLLSVKIALEFRGRSRAIFGLAE